MATIGIKSGVLPIWFGRAGYVVGVALLVVVSFFDWIVVILPVWIALISLYILRRERARRHAAGQS